MVILSYTIDIKKAIRIPVKFLQKPLTDLSENAQSIPVKCFGRGGSLTRPQPDGIGTGAALEDVAGLHCCVCSEAAAAGRFSDPPLQYVDYKIYGGWAFGKMLEFFAGNKR